MSKSFNLDDISNVIYVRIVIMMTFIMTFVSKIAGLSTYIHNFKSALYTMCHVKIDISF